MSKLTWSGQDHSEFYPVESKYQIGDTIPGTIGKVISKTYSHDNRVIYCIQFNGGFLTIAEDQIDSSIIARFAKQIK